MYTKRILPALFFFGMLVSSAYSQSDSTTLIIDEPYSRDPANFRKSNGGFKYSFGIMPDTTGLSNLNISGSAEFNDLNLPVMVKSIGEYNVTVIDLRQETHGFVNGMPLSWYGKYDWADVGLSRKEVIEVEHHKLDSLKKAGEVTVTVVLKKNKADDTFTRVRDTTFRLISVMTEEDLVKTYELGYLRITATDHRNPVTDDVDRFVDFVRRLKGGNNWLHFHCHAGDGRTTTFMVMYDMMKNAKFAGFADIIERQHLIGGIDLTKDEDFPSWDKQYAIERTQFLRDFYNYCRDNSDDFTASYSAWLRK